MLCCMCACTPTCVRVCVCWHKYMNVRGQFSRIWSVVDIVHSVSFFFLWCLAYFRFWTQKCISQSHLPSLNENVGITDVHNHIWLLRWTLGSKLRLWSFVASILPTEAFSRPLSVNLKWNSKTIPLGFRVCNSSGILSIKKYSNLLI